KSQSFAFGGELFTHTTSTSSGGVTFAKPFSCGEFSYCHKKSPHIRGLNLTVYKNSVRRETG
ncbi:hypothetical protein, partial [Streptomyces nogalater]